MSATTDDQREALGEKTGATLLSMFQDTYRQEVAAEEDVHRTLPFFATALGVIIAALNYAAAQTPGWAGRWTAVPLGLALSGRARGRRCSLAHC